MTDQVECLSAEPEQKSYKDLEQEHEMYAGLEASFKEQRDPWKRIFWDAADVCKEIDAGLHRARIPKDVDYLFNLLKTERRTSREALTLKFQYLHHLALAEGALIRVQDFILQRNVEEMGKACAALERSERGEPLVS